jgi:glycosyl transferase, family 25
LKCYVINLDRSPQRLAGVSEQFDAAGVSFERVSAVDGELLPLETLAAVIVSRPDYRPLTPSEIGCMLSHRAIWQHIATGTDSFAAIFEDDIHLAVSGANCLKEPSWIPPNSDLIKLEAYSQKVWIGRRHTSASANHSLARLWSTHWGTAGYIVSRHCAARLVKATNKFSVTADDILFNPRYAILRDTVIYQINPAICVQRQSMLHVDEDDPFQSTVRSHPPGPETQFRYPKLVRETARILQQVWRLSRLQAPVRVDYQAASDD